jgi:hypothetical protein
MRWLLALETDNDPIPACRLMNVFRRKSVQVVTLALAAEPAGFSLLAVVESRESDVEHVFHFLRSVGGVRRVSGDYPTLKRTSSAAKKWRYCNGDGLRAAASHGYVPETQSGGTSGKLQIPRQPVPRGEVAAGQLRAGSGPQV